MAAEACQDLIVSAMPDIIDDDVSPTAEEAGRHIPDTSPSGTAGHGEEASTSLGPAAPNASVSQADMLLNTVEGQQILDETRPLLQWRLPQPENGDEAITVAIAAVNDIDWMTGDPTQLFRPDRGVCPGDMHTHVPASNADRPHSRETEL